MENLLETLAPRDKHAVVREWANLLRVTESSPNGVTDERSGFAFRDLFTTYCDELDFRSGIGNPYVEAPHRLRAVKAMIADIDSLLDHLASLSDDTGHVPAMAKQVCQLLFGIAYDLVLVINLLERNLGQNDG
jgi:hypothetical protein